MLFLLLAFVLVAVLLFLINYEEPTLVLFASDTCHNCTNFYPTWHRIAETTTIKKKVVKGEGCARYNVQYVPEIRLYKGFGYTTYNGNRTYEDLMDFIKKSW